MVERLTQEDERRIADALLLVRDACLGPEATAQETVAYCIMATAREVEFYQIAQAERERLENPAVH